MDAILTLKEIEGFFPPRKIKDLKSNYIDSLNHHDFRILRSNNNY